MQTIWVVDDENNIRELIRRYLEKDGYRVRTFANAEELESALISGVPDMFILDIMLPGADGLALCRKIRKEHDLPVIFVSARSEEFDRVLGLELGADDYLAKPFSPRELVIRVTNIFKRIQPTEIASKPITLGNVSIYTEQRKITVNGEETNLTAKEFDLFSLLAAESGRSFSRRMLLEKIWGFDYEGDERAIDDTVKRIRKKLREKGARPELSTIRGYGYRIDV
ncbi:MAG: response regulator transcription factor [Bacillota bacterium]|nr:response regulator transcription factor [Bacillota bacterium]MDW7730202.1 response regulator transcription factor [Bacillota bacterium]